MENDNNKRTIAQLSAKIAELERQLNQKEVLINFHSKVFDTAEEMYGINIKKKFGIKPSSDGNENNSTIEPKE